MTLSFDNFFWRKVADDQAGATSIEYGLIVALIAMTLVVALDFVGTGSSDLFGGVGTALQETEAGMGSGG